MRPTARQLLVTVVSVAAVALLAGCSSAEVGLSDFSGDCTFEPQTQCTNQDLAAVSFPSTDLTGADFSGSSFRRADLRYAILRNANLTGAILSGANLTGADLRGADLSGAELFETVLDGARWAGSNRSDIKLCHSFMPDGTVSGCTLLEVQVPAEPADPPSVVSFGPHRPVRCFNDAAGDGIEVDWKIRDASSAGFLIDGIEAGTAFGKEGIKRLPFPCDGQTHSVTIRAFGTVPPLAASSFSLRVEPSLPQPPVR